MNIYKISQNTNNNYDTFDSAVVIAEDEQAAANIVPTFPGGVRFDNITDSDDWILGLWCYKIEDVIVRFIGTTTETKERVVLASFNAG